MKSLACAMTLLLPSTAGASAASVECVLWQSSTVHYEVTQTISKQVGTEIRKPLEIKAHYFRTSPNTMDGYVLSADGSSYLQFQKLVNGLPLEMRMAGLTQTCVYTPGVETLTIGGEQAYSVECKVKREAGKAGKLEVAGCEMDVLAYKTVIDFTPDPASPAPASRVERDVYFAPSLQIVVMQKSDETSVVDGKEAHTLMTTVVNHFALNPKKLEMK